MTLSLMESTHSENWVFHAITPLAKFHPDLCYTPTSFEFPPN